MLLLAPNLPFAFVFVTIFIWFSTFISPPSLDPLFWIISFLLVDPFMLNPSYFSCFSVFLHKNIRDFRLSFGKKHLTLYPQCHLHQTHCQPYPMAFYLNLSPLNMEDQLFSVKSIVPFTFQVMF